MQLFKKEVYSMDVTMTMPSSVDLSTLKGSVGVTLNNRNFYLVDPESYERMAKAMRNAEYLAMLDRGFEQMKAGTCRQHDLIETDDE